MEKKLFDKITVEDLFDLPSRELFYIGVTKDDTIGILSKTIESVVITDCDTHLTVVEDNEEYHFDELDDTWFLNKEDVTNKLKSVVASLS